MTKKHFIALADTIRMANKYPGENGPVFTENAIDELADFCKSVNYRFDHSLWKSYIKGECGPSGGKVKTCSVCKGTNTHKMDCPNR